MEDPSRLGPDVLHQGVSQSDAAHAAWLCVLDLVDTSGRLPKAIPMAAGAVRYSAPALGQTRGHHRREENPHRPDIAGLIPTPVADQAVICGIAAASAHLTLNNTPRQPQQSQPINTHRQERLIQNQGGDQPCAIETGKAANNPSAAKTGCS